MKRLILLFSLLLCLTTFGVNVTNYPLTNNYSGNELFLLSSIPLQTNFNLPGNYVAKTSDLNSASNSILSQMPTTNGFVGTSVTNGLIQLDGTNYWTGTNSFSNSVIIQQQTANTGLIVSNGANSVTASNGVLRSSGGIIAPSITSTLASYNQPNFFNPVSGDANWSFGIYNVGSDFWMQARFSSSLLSTLRGFRVVDANVGDTKPVFSTCFTQACFSGNIIVSNDIYAKGTLTATNGIVVQRLPCTSNAVTVVAGQQIYCVNGTNQLITLPAANASWGTNIIYRFTSTNGWGSFIITNANGATSIRDGTSLAYTNIGVGEIGLFSDGAAWWLASKGRTIFPSASWSSATTITPAQDTITNIPWTDLEFNNSQGITLRTNATFVRPTELWVTNSGTYMITFSAVLKGSAGGSVLSIWLRKNGSDVARTRTDQMFSGTSAQQCMTVNYFVHVGDPAFFELCAASHDASPPTIVGGTANPTGYTAPAMPAVIVTVNRVSDPWP